MVKVKMHVTFKDYKKKGKYMFFHSIFYRILLLLLIVLCAFSFWKGVLQKQQPVMDIIGAVLFYAVIIIGFLEFSWRIYLIYLSVDKDLFPLTGELSLEEEGIRIKSDYHEYFVIWSQITSISDVEKYIFFKKRKRAIFTIYKELITSEELASVRVFLEKGKAKGADTLSG